jgi:hypothetical protein
MTPLTDTLIAHLVKRHGMNILDATMIIDEEWDYIETLYHEELDINTIAKELLAIYMVA